MSPDQIKTWESGGKWIHPHGFKLLSVSQLELSFVNKFGEEIIEVVDFLKRAPIPSHLKSVIKN